jgi:hypothetical protein
MKYKDLKRRVSRGERPEAEIHSVEGMLYLVRIDDETLLESGGSGRALRFPSAEAAARALGRLGLERGWLVHASPYDEMVGRPDEGLPPPAPLRTPLAFPQRSDPLARNDEAGDPGIPSA